MIETLSCSTKQNSLQNWQIHLFNRELEKKVFYFHIMTFTYNERGRMARVNTLSFRPIGHLKVSSQANVAFALFTHNDLVISPLVKRRLLQ